MARNITQPSLFFGEGVGNVHSMKPRVHSMEQERLNKVWKAQIKVVYCSNIVSSEGGLEGFFNINS